MTTLKNVDYDSLDKAKNAFIEASRSTLKFAEKYGFVPGESLGASANIFSLDLRPFIKSGADSIFVTLLPEGLGTADDACPGDLSEQEKKVFWNNIATKTISTLTNDASASGLQTILIALYLPSSTPESVFDEAFMQGFLPGFVDGCRKIGCVYLSGETPQLKSKIYPGKIDIAGALFAICPPERMPIDGSKLAGGNQIVLVESSGPHENGFTVLRQLAESLPNGYRTKLPSGQEYWQAINAPSKLYSPFVQAILAAGVQPTAFENITGHGWQKLMRSKKSLRYVIQNMLPVTEVFQFVEKYSKSSPLEMLKVFNYGAGFAVYLENTSDVQTVLRIAKENKLNAIHAGKVEEAKEREVVIGPLNISLSSKEFALKRS